MVDHQIDIDRNATWAGMGTGKTGVTATALKMVQELLDPRPALVLAPKRVASRTWPREMQKWDHLDGDCTPILGSAADRMAALRGGLRRGNSRMFSINYENIPWLIDTLTDLKAGWPFATVIADESTKLKSYRTRQGGARAQALSKVAFLSDRFWELTGTPAPNGYKDLWGQLWFLDRGQRLGKSYSAYMNRWFRQDYTGFGWDIMDHSPAEIEARLRDICLSVSVPVEKPLINKVYVDLPPKVRDVYRKMEKESFVEIGEKGVEALIAAGRINKCLQIAAGALYDEDGVAHHLHDAKIEALESIVAEAAGMPVLVAINFKFEAAAILRAFGAQARLLDTDQDIDDFAAGKIGVGVAHPGMLGHGVNDMEHGTNIYVFYGGDWNLEYHDQIIERVGPMRQKQSGYDRPVYGHYILAENTWDEEVFERRVEKITVQEGLRRATERRHHG
jgi:hypothetical protein